MSRGIGGNCRVVEEDEHTVIYEYGGYNLNKPEYRNPDRICDGLIVINKRDLFESDTHVISQEDCENKSLKTNNFSEEEIKTLNNQFAERTEKHISESTHLKGHRKAKRKIVKEFSPMEFIESGKIQIQNCSNCWHTFPSGKDIIAYYLIFHIFDKYQEDGHLPPTVSYNV